MRKFLFLIVGLISFPTFSQIKSQELEEIEVPMKIERKNMSSQQITQEEIKESQPEDLGQMMQKFAGVSMKNYGGLGGLKTFSFRSIGSQHTAILQDGFPTINNQVGQINLGQIQMQTTFKVLFSSQDEGLNSPISSLVMANTLNVVSQLNTFEPDTTHLTISSKYGSFSQCDNFLSFQKSNSRIQTSFFVKNRQSEGNYPFTVKEGNFEYSSIRTNNQLEEWYGGLTFMFKPKKTSEPVRIIYNIKYIDQELPGAVVFFNNTAHQALFTRQNSIKADYSSKWKKNAIRYYASYDNDYLSYRDEGFLNAAKLLISQYRQDNSLLGVSWKNKMGSKMIFTSGAEGQRSNMISLQNSEELPQRDVLSLHGGMDLFLSFFKIKFSGSAIIANDLNRFNDSVVKSRFVAPKFSLTTKKIGKMNLEIGYLSSYTQRLPSFGELYYGQVGEVQLRPEKVFQNQLSFSAGKSIKRLNLNTKLYLYQNNIEDKIVAIPTKNLFVWSIQNVGKVQAYGVDIVQSATYYFKKETKLNIRANYSQQISLDKTDPDSPTYNDQIAYIPVHSGNVEGAFHYKKCAVRVSGLFVGSRYSLNQNNDFNQLDGFSVFDFYLSRTFLLNKRHELSLQGSIKNINNSSYSVVRSFIMPGRNYLISMTYAF
ncbi:MAG: vitamin B12 transporter [Lentimonas sp.]